MKLLALIDAETIGVAKRIGLGPPETLVIVANTVTITRSYHLLFASGSPPQRRLATVGGGEAGDLVLFRLAPGSGSVTARDGEGNLHLAGHCDLASENDVLVLFCLGSTWVEVTRSINS